MHQTELGPRAGEVGGQGGLHRLLAAEGVDQDPASVKVRGYRTIGAREGRISPRDLRPVTGDWRGQAGVARSGDGGRWTRK